MGADLGERYCCAFAEGALARKLGLNRLHVVTPEGLFTLIP